MFAKKSGRRVVWHVVLTCMLAAVAPATTTAGDLSQLDASLKLIPADAAFYSSMLRNREQFEALRNSNAWKKIQAMPVVQLGLSMYEAQQGTTGSGPAQIGAALKNPEVRKIVDLLIDMASHEVFVYGEKGWGDFIGLLHELNTGVQYGPMIMQATGQAGFQDPTELQAAAAISVLAEHADKIVLPGMVLGFKLQNAKLAEEQLIKLEAICNVVLEGNEQTKGRFKKVAVGEYEYLTLELDGGMVPWDEAMIEKLQEMEAAEGDAQKIVERLKELKLVVGLGLRDNYLLLSIGPSLACLERLGQGELLIDRAEIKPLEKFADQRLTSIGYLSAEAGQKINNGKKSIDDLLALAEKLLLAMGLDEEPAERIRADLAAVAEEIKNSMPEVGAVAGVNFISDAGLESYQYNWTDNKQIDASKPLGLIQHVGGNPLLAVVSHATPTSVEDYDRVVSWLKKAYGYFEELALPNIPEPDAGKMRQFLAGAMPQLERIDKANREMLIPALADGQSAFVLDAKLQSRQYFAHMPQAEKPLPMIEPALVMGLSDAELLKQGLSEYHAAINGLIDAMRRVEGTDVPEDFKLPVPVKQEVSGGEIYSIPLPEDWGIDKQIEPNLGISETAAVLSLSPAQTQRILQSTSPVVGGVLTQVDRPRAMAGWLDWPALVDAVAPWVDYGLTQAANSGNIDSQLMTSIAAQVHTGLEVLKAIRSITSESYVEDGVLVTHTLLEIRDVAD